MVPLKGNLRNLVEKSICGAEFETQCYTGKRVGGGGGGNQPLFDK